MTNGFELASLPTDHDRAILAGRVSSDRGPIPVIVRGGRVYDVSMYAAKSADWFDLPDPISVGGRDLCGIGELTVGEGPHELLSPIDLQCVKACGVTLAISAVERVIEERARGDAVVAATIRAELESDDVRSAELNLSIDGLEGYRLEGRSLMREISRDPIDLIRQTPSEHQYPAGFALFLGTLFAPVKGRYVAGAGFTHKIGGRVVISTPSLGMLVNRVVTSRDAAPWTYGIRSLYRSLASRPAVVA